MVFGYTINRNMKKSTKVVYISLAVLFAVLMIGGLVLAFMLNYNLYCPEYVKIIYDGKNIYLTTSSNENYRLYRFILTDEVGNKIVIDSENNTLQSATLMESGVELGKTYTIQSQYLSENAGNNSAKSNSITWTAFSYLGQTKGVYDVDRQILSWQGVKNATGYNLILQGMYNSYTIFVDADKLNIDKYEFDFRGIIGDSYQAQIFPVANSNAYKSPVEVESFSFIYNKTLSDFTDLSFDKENKILECQNVDLINSVSVSVNGTSYSTSNFEVEQENGVYIYSIPLSIFNDFSRIGVRAEGTNQFNYSSAYSYLTITDEEI